MSAFTCDLHSLSFWLLLAGFFLGGAVGLRLRGLRRQRQDGVQAASPGCLFLLSGMCAALLGALVFTDLREITWQDHYGVVIGAAAVFGAASTAFSHQVGLPLLLLVVLLCAVAATALDGLVNVKENATLLQLRVLSVQDESTVVECSPNLPGGDLVVSRISGNAPVVQAERYRRRSWFFLSRPGYLYGELEIMDAGADERVVCRSLTPVRGKLLDLLVGAGVMMREQVTAVNAEAELLARYALIADGKDLSWRKILP